MIRNRSIESIVSNLLLTWEMKNLICFAGGTHFTDTLSVCLSVCLSTCLSICLSIYLSVCLSVRLSVCLSVRPPVYLSVRPPACLSVCPPACLSVCPPACLSVCLSVRTQLSSHLTDFHEIWYLSIFSKICTKIRSSLKSDKKRVICTKTNVLYISRITVARSVPLRMRNAAQL
jgi:hypothetical protein